MIYPPNKQTFIKVRDLSNLDNIRFIVDSQDVDYIKMELLTSLEDMKRKDELKDFDSFFIINNNIVYGMSNIVAWLDKELMLVGEIDI
jgi:hypothetical protein